MYVYYKDTSKNVLSQLPTLRIHQSGLLVRLVGWLFWFIISQILTNTTASKVQPILKGVLNACMFCGFMEQYSVVFINNSSELMDDVMRMGAGLGKGKGSETRITVIVIMMMM